MPGDIDTEVTKWRRWIDGPIKTDVVDMHFKRMIWREVNEMVGANARLGEMPSAFWNFHHENYAAAQAIAIRRQADKHPLASSLAVLIREMRDKAHLLTRAYFVGLVDDQTDEWAIRRAHSDFDQLAGDVGDHLNPEIPRRHFAELRSDAKRVSTYVNEHIAHDMAEPTIADMPTYAELHAAVDSVGGIFKKYSAVLASPGWPRLEPCIQGDWRSICRIAWLR